MKIDHHFMGSNFFDFFCGNKLSYFSILDRLGLHIFFLGLTVLAEKSKKT